MLSRAELPKSDVANLSGSSSDFLCFGFLRVMVLVFFVVGVFCFFFFKIQKVQASVYSFRHLSSDFSIDHVVKI